MTLATQNNKNPYYDAWEKLTGGGANWEFINWMNRRWLEIEIEFKRPRRTIKPEEFLEWLQERGV
jgi:hypothetical protein